jgi:hypothetical protein
MSASSKVPVAVQTGAIAHVNFRVRCETLGHGEEVFLAQELDTRRQKVRRAGDAGFVIALIDSCLRGRLRGVDYGEDGMSQTHFEYNIIF